MALTLLVLPQLPLTLGNAVVGAADLARDAFGPRARRVTPGRLALSSGVANLVAGLAGGIPLCHGSSGTTAYARMGARTGVPLVTLGAVLVAGGAGLGGRALWLASLVPAPVLAGLLAYTGVRHALLVADQRGLPLATALAMGLVGAATRNLMWGMAVGLGVWGLAAGARRLRSRGQGALTGAGR